MKLLPEITRKSFSFVALTFVPLTAMAWEPPLVSATADAHGNYGIPGNVKTDSGTSGFVQAQAQQPSYNVVSNTSAKAKMGNLFGKVRAVDDDGYYYASGTTKSQWRDVVTFNAPGKTGQIGYANFNYKVTGISTFESNDGNCRTGVSVSASVYNGATWQSRPGKTTLPDGSFLGDDFLGKVVSTEFRFTYGEPFQLDVILDTSSSTSGSGGGVGFAEIDAELIWLGFSNIRTSDAYGIQTIDPDARVRSESQINYVRPIGDTYATATIQSALSRITENPQQSSTITVSLNKPAPTSLRVGLAYTGTATAMSDYATARPTHVYFSKGSTQATFTIKSKNDALVEDREKVSVHLLPGIGYGVGTLRTASIAIDSED